MIIEECLSRREAGQTHQPGKGTVASVVEGDSLARSNVTPQLTFATAYFYCSNGNAQTTTCIAVLRGLISQLLSANPDLLLYCHEKFSKSGETLLSSMQLAKQLFELFCESTPRVAIIIDGLDECEKVERGLLLEYLNASVEKIHSTTPGKLRVLISSQQDGDIRKMMSSAEVLTLSVELNGDDIRSYVNHRLAEIAKKFDLDETLEKEVACMTCSKASGKYRGKLRALVCGHMIQRPWVENAFNWPLKALRLTFRRPRRPLVNPTIPTAEDPLTFAADPPRHVLALKAGA